MPLFSFATPRLALAIGTVAYVADPGAALRVLRATPAGEAAPTATIAVTFDRPVAGSLDRTVDPAKLVTVTPAIDGVTDWRDPVTLRFRPARPLEPNQSYTVTVSDDFEAMDGSRLDRPYTYTFRVRGARVLAGAPISPNQRERFLTPETKLELVTDAPVEPSVIEASVFLEFDKRCREPGLIHVTVDGARAIEVDDRWEFREAGGWDRDRSLDPMRRVVRLAPTRALPRGCTGWLVTPASFDDRGRATLQRWEFATYGDFTLARAACSWGAKFCPTGPIVAHFSTPVKGADVQRHLRLVPATKFSVGDTADVRASWVLEAALKPRTRYALIADTALTDRFGQRLTGNPASSVTTTGYAPSIDYPSGRSVVERNGPRTFSLSFVNVDTLDVLIAPIPDSLEPQFLAAREWRWTELWPALLPRAKRQRIAVRGKRDQLRAFGLKLPAPVYAGPGTPTLYALQVTSTRLDSMSRAQRPIAVVQVTDIGAHARVGTEDGVVWVTGANDGRARSGAAVTLHDAKGAALARATTDSAGLARFSEFARRLSASGQGQEDEDGLYASFDGYVSVVDRGDRAVVGINEYDPDLSPWRFNVASAWGVQRYPVAAALFTERDIYRPGEPVYAKAIVRAGALGALRAPSPSDSLRWLFKDRDNENGEAGTFRDTVVALSAFGTADQRVALPPTAALGHYQVVVQLKRAGRWVDVASTSYRIAEYRPPEFLVTVAADSGIHYTGDSLAAAIDARYLFGAPMGRAAVRWTLRQQTVSPWELTIPGLDGFSIGESGGWSDSYDAAPPVQMVASGVDTLDPAGRLPLRLRLGAASGGRPARATLEATVTDVNRQTVSATASMLVHPASFYLGARSLSRAYFWTAGKPESVSVVAARPDGRRVTGVRVEGTIVRQEWHQVRRERNGYAELVGEWVHDTVARCAVTTSGATGDVRACRFTPPLGGSYLVHFRATDDAGREVATSLFAWAVGGDWVPWNDESQLKMDVVLDRARYTVGDTATVLFASPFTDADAWITVEREGLIEQRRLRLTSGTTTLRLPITEALAPNAFVSIVVARGRSAKPGTLDDPGRPTIRVGYAELRVTPERKRLTVDVAPAKQEYRPGDTTRISLRVRDAAGTGQRTEVTLWAVDEGVLSLTGYATPDPLDLLYQPRGLGMRLASNLTTVAPQIAEGVKGRRAPGGGGGRDGADILRSRFQTTAFFLGSVVTDANGRATVSAKVPDNLTTFRLMAVAVTAGDRFGSGQSPMLVTRPLVARPALPRFLRDGDRFAAGVVVNSRLGGTPKVTVSADATGAKITGGRQRTARLAAGRGREMRFDFRAAGADSIRFRFDAKSGKDADAVAITLPRKPSYHSRAYTVAGVLRDTAVAEFVLPANLDPARSRLELNLGASPLSILRGAYRRLRVYPYWCTEQLASEAEPLLGLYRARHELGADSLLFGDAKAQLAQVVATVSRRQRSDGGIGFWHAADWTTPWLSARAGSVLLEARAIGVAVDDSVLARLGRYLKASLAVRTPVVSPVAAWYDDPTVRLSDRVMAVDYLSRAGQRDRAAENELQRTAAQLAWEDRAHLALVLARAGDVASARRLLQPMWAAISVEGRVAALPAPSRRDFYFMSRIRPAARLLHATLLVEPSHALVGPLVERVVAQRQEPGWMWNTQDYATAVAALAEFQRRQQAAVARGLEVRAGARVLWRMQAGQTSVDSSVALKGLLTSGNDSAMLRLTLAAPQAGVPMFYYLTVVGVPSAPPVRPDDRGMQVERWYERYSDGAPIAAVAEGELVRVRLRLTVPADRHFVMLDDPLPAGLEAVDLSLRTAGGLPGPGVADSSGREAEGNGEDAPLWSYGSWDGGWWSPFDHKEIRDDRVVHVATRLWKGTYSATYVARATTPGTFARPPAHAEEMYNPAVYGESDGGVFTVTRVGAP